MDNLDVKEALKFIELVTSLKHLSRKGWAIRNVKNHESVASHMYAMAMMTFLIDDKSDLDRNKCMQLALVHDLAESIVGDITPQDNVPADVKHKLEMEAMKDLSRLIGKQQGDKLVDLYTEYADKITNEAKFVKDLDRFDMIFTASSYEERENKPGMLQEFFDSTEGKFEHPFIKKLVDELGQKRQRLECLVDEPCINKQK